MKNKIEILSDRDHVLLRPSMYIGAIDETEVSDFIINDEKIEYQTIKYVPGLVKLIDEIITNSIDEAIRNNFKKANLIKVTVDNDRVIVEDNGGGIPILKEEKTKEYMPVIAWGRAKSGANFNDDERVTIGLNGVGSFATNVFSTKFVGETCDGHNTLKVVFKDNAEKYNIKIEETNKAETFTKVVFWPDLKRFKLDKITDVYCNMIKQKLLNFAISYPDITFKFNGKTINIRKGKRFLELFGENFEYLENDRFLVGILPNTFDDFKHYSFVNGLKMVNGGNHVDFLVNEIIPTIRDRFKKYELKPGDIKNKLVLVCFLKNFPNAKFDSQTKERLTNSAKEVMEFFSSANLQKLAVSICKNDAIIDPIIETFKIKEELKERLSINKINKGSKKIRCDKYIPSIKNNKYFVIAEGLSATNALMPILGREDFAFFSCRGVPLNSYETTVSKMLENDELSNIIQILEMRVGEDKATSISFDNVLLAQDADLDGSKIKGLLVGFFNRYSPYLFKAHKIKTLKTPIIVLKTHGSIKKFFFTFDEYNEYIKNHDISKMSIEYKKGLGSWKVDDLKMLIKENKIEMFIEDLDPDETSDKLIHDWLSKETSDTRKEYLRQNNFNIFAI